jgi:hypothetical protein
MTIEEKVNSFLELLLRNRATGYTTTVKETGKTILVDSRLLAKRLNIEDFICLQKEHWLGLQPKVIIPDNSFLINLCIEVLENLHSLKENDFRNLLNKSLQQTLDFNNMNIFKKLLFVIRGRKLEIY